jgi:ABC-type multidrug transport system ATPase subunit
MSAAIEIRGLTKRFKNGVLANDYISLEVPAGTVFGLLGPNGAGKTTLIRQLAGELQPTSGSVQILGVDVLTHPTEAKTFMSIVPQSSGVFYALTAEENIRIFAQLHGLSRPAAKDKTEQLLSALNLKDHRKKLAMYLSGGTIRKLVVAMALTGDPKVLLLDEPTTGLDPNSRREVWSIIHSCQRAGATVLLTTHYMEEAEALCGRVAILAKGRMAALGSIDEIRSLCSNQFKATYERDGAAEVIYGRTHEAVIASLESLGVLEYAVGKTSLEEIYLELTREPETV